MLHRSVWGDVAYGRHVFERRALFVSRRVGLGVLAALFVALGVGILFATRLGPTRFSTAGTPPSTAVPAAPPTEGPVVTTAAVGSSTRPAAPPRPTAQPLANTGAHDALLFGVAAVLVSSGIAFRAGGRPQRRSYSASRYPSQTSG